jgi:hypothetical protein
MNKIPDKPVAADQPVNVELLANNLARLFEVGGKALAALGYDHFRHS